jgi:hypothetical protein
MHMKIRFVAVALPLTMALGAAASLLAAQDPPKPFAKEYRMDVQASIEAVNPATREITLRDPNGPATMVAGPEVRNFSQIRVGDVVHVTYRAALAAQITKKKGVNGAPIEIMDTYRAPVGERPAAAAANTISTVVKIQSVDTKLNSVTFKRPDGIEITLPVESDEGHKFIRTLKPGEEVEVVYTEAVAIAVVPGKG